LALVTRQRIAASTALALATLVLSGCEHIHDHKGYVVDTQLINSVQPGVDNKDSVQKTLGRPSLTSEFDGGNTWYYFARETRQFGSGLPKPIGQTLLAVRFARSGDVSAVQKTGMETIRKVKLYGRQTPTLGRNRGFFQELFGNIGAGGSNANSAPTADNPDG
jgi:outer membrane protein assembly factor BamE (lipoprotein component of BamABCDE complex)